MRFPIARISLALIAATAITASPARAQESFDVRNAIAVEGLFRGAAQRCGSPAFAERFISLSKTLVAFSLQGDGPIDTAKIEETIVRYAQDPEFQNLTPEQCAGTLPKLEALYQNRMITLQESQSTTDALRELDRNGGIP